jgi:hypothetical protein
LIGGGGKRLLIAFHFSPTEPTHRLKHSKRSSFVTGRWDFVLGCLIAVAGCSGVDAAKAASRVTERSRSVPALLVATPSRIDVGEVPGGGRKQAVFSLTNPGTQAVELSRIETSCPCLTVDMPHYLAPAEQVSAGATLDLRDEPDFTGEMAIEITGWTRAGEQAFAVVVEVKVPHNSAR